VEIEDLKCCGNCRFNNTAYSKEGSISFCNIYYLQKPFALCDKWMFDDRYYEERVHESSSYEEVGEPEYDVIEKISNKILKDLGE